MRDEVKGNICYKFGDFRLETDKLLLLRGDKPVHLAKRPFEILLYLVENRSRAVSRDELLEKFWEGHDVYDDALRKAIHTIRQALEDTERPWSYIETLRGSGFRFVGEAEIVQTSPTAQLLDKGSVQKTVGSPDIPMWRSRFVLLTLTCLILLLSTSFAAKVYFQRAPKNDLRKVRKLTSIVVLPLRNLTGDSANEYLSDGLSEGLISEFSRHGDISVISRSSSFAFKNKDVEPGEISEKLKVDAILEGSLQKSGDEFRIDARLVDAVDGKILWTNDAATTTVRNVFAAQNKIACDLLVKIEAGNCTRSVAAQNIDPEAYKLYLRGVQLRRDLSLDGLTKAASFYEQALAIAPDFADAHAALATTYVIMESNSFVPLNTVIKKAEFHANEAMRIDDSSVDALLVLSETKTSENYDLELRENLLRQAVEKNPNHARARMWLANLLTVQGKFSEAENELLYAQQIDPLSYGVRLNLAELYFYWRKPEKVLEQTRFLPDQGTENGAEYWIRVRAYLQQGDTAKAREYWSKLADDEKDDTSIEFDIKDAKTLEARAEIEKLAESEKGKTAPYRIACLYSLLGDREKAFYWLDRSYAMRQADLISLKVDPALDNIRDDARYAAMVSRVNLVD